MMERVDGHQVDGGGRRRPQIPAPSEPATKEAASFGWPLISLLLAQRIQGEHVDADFFTPSGRL